jgi:hypothetical protein
MEVARPDGLREHHDIYEQGSDGETEPGNDSLPVLDDESHASTTPVNGRSRSRSILSVSSMRDNTCMSREVSSGGRDDDKERETLGRRIAQIGGFRRGSPAPDTAYDRNDRNDRHDRLSPSQPQFPPSSQSLLPTFMSNRLGNAGSIGRRGPAPLDEALHERFMTCDPGDIRLTEVPVLLREYRRLVASLRGGP